MGKIGNNQAMIISSIALDAYTVAANTVGIKDRVMIDPNVDLVSLNLIKA